MLTYLFLTLFISKTISQYIQNVNTLPSVIREENLDDSITQIFNRCRCVFFYLCDEQNFIIPPAKVSTTKILTNDNLRSIRRIRCSNEFYYCCRNKTAASRPYVIPTSKQSKPHNSHCGRSSSYSSVIGEFPWIVALFQDYNQRECIYKCGGALIHPKVVLTGQHCVREATSDSLKIMANTQNAENRISRAVLFSNVEKIIRHNDYSSEASHNDIALLILETPIENINTVCLPRPNQSFNNKRCIAAGWGHNRVLRKVDLPIIDPEKCENLLQKTRLGVNFKLHHSFLCAGGEEGKDTCQGDGGSPLMCLDGNRYVQVGIVSWGVECGRTDVPSLYSNVPKFIKWIQKQLKKENVNLGS